MELRHLITFRNIVELKSFKKTAQKLNYSQSTVTEHIQIIERELGTPLFNRLGKTISVTHVGLELYQNVLELFEIYNKIQNLNSDDSNLKGIINIGASESLIVYKLQPVLSEFRKLHPNVNIRLISNSCSNLRKKIHTGELDLIITLGPKKEIKDLINHLIKKEPLVFIKSINHTLNQNTIKITDIIDECFIFTEKGCSLRNYFEKYLFNYSITPKSSLEFSSMEAIKKCVEGNLGISLLPLMNVENDINKGIITKINIQENLFFYSQISFHKDKWISPLMKEFINITIEKLN